VVASDVGGLAEVVLEGRTGYLAPAGDSRTMARKILKFYKEDKKEDFQKNIREFRQRLSWQQVADAIEDLLRSYQGEEQGVHE
jgi:glycosyltransferase involved in cell wall biosynthesis